MYNYVWYLNIQALHYTHSLLLSSADRNQHHYYLVTPTGGLIAPALGVSLGAATGLLVLCILHTVYEFGSWSGGVGEPFLLAEFACCRMIPAVLA